MLKNSLDLCDFCDGGSRKFRSRNAFSGLHSDGSFGALALRDVHISLVFIVYSPHGFTKYLWKNGEEIESDLDRCCHRLELAQIEKSLF